MFLCITTHKVTTRRLPMRATKFHASGLDSKSTIFHKFPNTERTRTDDPQCEEKQNNMHLLVNHTRENSYLIINDSFTLLDETSLFYIDVLMIVSLLLFKVFVFRCFSRLRMTVSCTLILTPSCLHE